MSQVNHFRFFFGSAILSGVLRRRKRLKSRVRLKVKNVVRAAKKRSKYTNYLRSPGWKKKRRERLQYANNQCERCQEPLTERTAEVHHRTYARFGNELLEDLEALCRPCHRRHHANTDNYKRR